MRYQPLETDDHLLRLVCPERKDGKKSYDAGPHSQEMQALNKKFSMLHGVSSLLNLGSFIGAVAYGVTLASRL